MSALSKYSGQKTLVYLDTKQHFKRTLVNVRISSIIFQTKILAIRCNFNLQNSNTRLLFLKVTT